jgi:predicted metalloprotease with PDZ domain
MAALALLGAAPKEQPTALVLRPVLDRGAFTAMDVAVSFNGEADGETVLELPDSWGGETELYKGLADLRAEGAELLPGAAPAKRVLRHAPRARITVRYRVSNAATDEHRGRNEYRPLIRSTHFQLFGSTYVALPEGIPETAPAAFALEGMPAGATFASDLQHGRRSAPLHVRDLTESVSVGGDFRVLDAGGGVRIAIRGAWPRDDATWRVQLQRIGASQREYWSAREEPYLVTVLPLNLSPGSISVGGTGMSDAFAFFATTNARPEQIDETLSHEMMHTWVPRRIGRLDEKDEELSYWLSEGFTEFASFRTNVRGGLWSPEQFAAAFNASVRAYDLSPVRTAPNAHVLAEFWRNGEVQRLPYRRGLLLATLWDHRVRAATAGRRDLDDVLLEMQEVARRRGDVSADRIFPVAMRRVGQVEVGVDLTTLVGEGAVVPLPEDIFAPCGKIVTTPQRRWERGFDFDATQAAGWKITGVPEGSNAHVAGLRNGMDLRSWSERSDERFPDRPVTAGVGDNGVERRITWLPASGEVRDVRELVLDPGMDRAACVKRLAGQ